MECRENGLKAVRLENYRTKVASDQVSNEPSQKVTYRCVLSFCLVLLIVILFSPTAIAQNDVGSIVGFVSDPSGALVSNAQVTVINQATNETRTVLTDAKGHYTFPNLVPAIYSLSFKAIGFKQFDSRDNTLASNSTIEVDGRMTIGAQDQTVEVTNTAEILQTQSAALQSEIVGEQIQK